MSLDLNSEPRMFLDMPETLSGDPILLLMLSEALLKLSLGGLRNRPANGIFTRFGKIDRPPFAFFWL
jgi:hypothetical protein